MRILGLLGGKDIGFQAFPKMFLWLHPGSAPQLLRRRITRWNVQRCLVLFGALTSEGMSWDV